MAEMTIQNWLVAAIGIPLLGGLVVLILPETVLRWLRPLTAVAAAGLALYCVINAVIMGLGLPLADARGPHSVPGWSFALVGGGQALRLEVAFYLDRLALLALLGIAVLGFLVIVYGWGGLVRNNRRGEFMGYALWAMAGAALAVTSDNLLMVLIGWELVSVMLFYLVTIGGDRARYSAGKTLVMLGLGDAALLLGVVMLYKLSGANGGYTLSMAELIGRAHPAIGAGGNLLALSAFVLIAVAALVKAGAMPLHTWVPKAAEGAPSETMALLPASIDKLLGIYLLARAGLFIFDWSGSSAGIITPQNVLMVVGAGTVVLATMSALVQHDLKKLLAYHAVSQVGYMVLGIASGTAVGVAGGIFHMVNHSIYKSDLFLCAGAIERRTGTTDLARLGGLGRKMPLTFSSMSIAALSISGVPPFNGFFSKWMIYAGLLQYAFAPGHSALSSVFLVAAMFGSALTLASFVKVLHSAFMGPLTRECAGAREVGPLMSSPMLVLAGLCVLLGVAPGLFVGKFLAPMVVEASLASGGALLGSISEWQGFATAAGGFWSPLLAAGLILVALGIGAVVFLTGTFQRARTVRPFLSGETTAFTAEETRFPGTGFYGTILELGSVATLYRDAAEGAYDLYEIVGHAGERLVGVGKRLHNGVLPTYLAFCLVGLLAALAALLVPLLLGG